MHWSNEWYFYTPLFHFIWQTNFFSLSDDVITSQITCLGENAAEVALDRAIEAYDHLKILLTSLAAAGLSEFYAKVMSQGVSDEPSSDNIRRLEFTSIPQDVRKFIDKTVLGKWATC